MHNVTNAGDSDENNRADETLPPARPGKDEEYSVMPTAAEADAQRSGASAPKLVHYSFWLWITAGLSAVAGAGLAFSAKDAMVDKAVEQNKDPRITEQMIEQGAGTLLWSLLVGSIILAVLYALCAYKIREGNRSARTMLIVLAVITVLFQYVFGSMIGLLSALLAVGALVLLFLPSTRDYFPQRRR